MTAKDEHTVNNCQQFSVPHFATLSLVAQTSMAVTGFLHGKAPEHIKQDIVSIVRDRNFGESEEDLLYMNGQFVKYHKTMLPTTLSHVVLGQSLQQENKKLCV